MTAHFRMLSGFRTGDAEAGYDVADLRYTPQLSYDLQNSLSEIPRKALGERWVGKETS